MKRITVALTIVMLLAQPLFAEQPSDMPILVIGASYDNGTTPINDALAAPLGGISVNLGSYLGLGDALVRTDSLNGFVINEAQAGATTYDRAACLSDYCLPIYWQGYEKQFQKALMRVAAPNPANPQQPLFYNAKYLVIGIANDCLHADAFGVPQSQSTPCGSAEFNAYVDRLVAVGQQALSVGITPVYTAYPKYENLDLPLAKQLYGLYWIIDEQSFNEMRDLHRNRLAGELPGAIVVDAWQHFQHMGDGLHPDIKSVVSAARKVAVTINEHMHHQH